jgi:sugar phosphate isomerase/epimerase
LADQIGARCCVNIAGSRNSNQWDGPDPENFSQETFDLIVESVRKIIDAVKPSRTFYTLETMPWIFPSSPDEYLALIKAIDRPAFAVHLDPVNMLNSPLRAYRNADFIRECFEKLGPWIKSCHAKDIVLDPKLTVHLNEARPGTGLLDYGVFLKEISKLGNDCPLMLEHLATDEEYEAGANYIREVAKSHQINIQ